MATKDKKYVMQTRCYHCMQEQYALNVYRLSTEGGPCTWCGKPIKPMKEREYQKKLKGS